MNAEESKRLVRGFVEQVLNNRNLDAAGAYMAADVVEQVPFPGQGPGLAGLKDVLRGLFAAFPDMHRELYRFFHAGDTVVVELALQGTHKGPLHLPFGTILPTGKRMNAPCCDVFRLKNRRIQSFNCYLSSTIVLTQLGVFQKLEAVLGR